MRCNEHVGILFSTEEWFFSVNSQKLKLVVNSNATACMNGGYHYLELNGGGPVRMLGARVPRLNRVRAI